MGGGDRRRFDEQSLRLATSTPPTPTVTGHVAGAAIAGSSLVVAVAWPANSSSHLRPQMRFDYGYHSHNQIIYPRILAATHVNGWQRCHLGKAGRAAIRWSVAFSCSKHGAVVHALYTGRTKKALRWSACSLFFWWHSSGQHQHAWLEPRT